MTGEADGAGVKPRVLLLTQATFWRVGAGRWTRLAALLPLLAADCRLTVALCRPLATAPEAELLASLGATFTLLPMPATLAGDQAGVSHWIAQRFTADAFDVCWIDKTELSYLLPLVPPGVRTIVDTHDLLSQRGPSYAARGLVDRSTLSEAQEREVLALYDRVICIQAEDRALVARWLGPERTLLAPHPVSPTRHPRRESARSVAFVASAWQTNEDGIRWFLAEVWPAVQAEGLTLDVYGWIGDALEDCAGTPGLRRHGHQPSLQAAYARADVVINPVHAGAGLKIKSVEALAHGLPLLTTSEGARGLRHLHGKALWIADTAEDFAQALKRLLAEPGLRASLGEAAFDYAGSVLGPEACFREIRAWLRAGAPAALSVS